MREFEFRSAGIRVVFRGEQLFLSPQLLTEFEDKYVGRVSERTLQAMLVVAQNVEALRHRAAKLGDMATFNTWTFWLDTEDLPRWRRPLVAGSHVYLQRVKRLTGACLTWVIEFGRIGGRMHGHFVADRWMELELQERARAWEWSLIGRCHVTALAAPGYMWKELGKSVGRRGTGIRLMGSLGEFAGRCRCADFLIDSPMAECRRLAWRVRVTGEPQRLTWERAREYYAAWSAGKLNLGAEYDRWRGRISGGGGDAWEGEDGKTDFDVEDFEP